MVSRGSRRQWKKDRCMPANHFAAPKENTHAENLRESIAAEKRKVNCSAYFVPRVRNNRLIFFDRFALSTT